MGVGGFGTVGSVSTTWLSGSHDRLKENFRCERDKPDVLEERNRESDFEPPVF